MKIAIIGNGKIGSAFTKALTKRGTKVVATRRENENLAAVVGASVILLAVKPQVLAGVLKQLRGKIPQDALVISVVAGKTLASIADGLQHERVVRAMPNLPSQIRQGVTGWYAQPHEDLAYCVRAKQIFAAVGDAVEVQHEEELNMLTALSGSGPAYVFLFVETLVRAGIMIGLPAPVARKFAIKTVAGSVAYLAQAGESESELIERVMTAKGTTAAALAKLIKFGFQHALIEAVKAADSRARELGK